MKRVLLIPIVATLLLSAPCFANPVKEEALQSISTARDLLEDGNYNKALEELQYAMSKLNELTAEELLSYIPESSTGFKLINKQSQGIGAAGAAIAGNAGATAQYEGTGGESINLNIALGGMTGKMGSLAALGSVFAGLNQSMGGETGGEQMKQIRVKGYTGTQMFNAQNQSGTLSFQVGAKTSVTIEGSGISSPDALLGLAKQIDFAKLEKNF